MRRGIVGAFPQAAGGARSIIVQLSADAPSVEVLTGGKTLSGALPRHPTMDAEIDEGVDSRASNLVLCACVAAGHK